MLTTAGQSRACPQRAQFNLEWDPDEFGNQVFTNTIWRNCQGLDANKPTCVSSFNRKYNLTSPENGKVKIRPCKLDSPWFWGDPYCTADEDNTCSPPQGNSRSISDYYAELDSKTRKVSLGFGPCGWNYPIFGGRMKNPDTKDRNLHIWSNGGNVCNKLGIDANNEKCKHYNQTISCERRDSKESCEQVETGCSMYEGNSCCSWNDNDSKCIKNTQGCNRHTGFTECNSDASKMCRWGPDYNDYNDRRSPGCYPNKRMAGFLLEYTK